MENIKLEITEDALKAISKKAIERKTGARGLRSILENILLEPMYDLPGMETVEKVVINKEVVDSKAQPLLIHGEKPAATKGEPKASA
jgi:ATP-dependent Clp protease ATP-binding subunit ClpX